MPYAQVCGEMHPLGMKVQELACALDLASSEKPVYCDFLKAPDDAAIAIAQRGRIQVRVLDLHNTWPGWVLYDLLPGAANSEPYFNFSMRLLVEGFPWYEKMVVLRRKAEAVLADAQVVRVPDEIITSAVAVKDFYVSRSTLRAAVKAGHLKDYRPPAKRRTTSPLKLSRAELSRLYSQKKN